MRRNSALDAHRDVGWPPRVGRRRGGTVGNPSRGDTLGAIELDRVHRVNAGWERAANLRRRHGDTSVVELYE